MSLSAREEKVCGLIRDRAGAMLDDLRLHVGLPTGGRNLAALDESRGRLTGRAEALGAIVQVVPGEARPEWLYGERPGEVALPTAVCRRSGTPGAREALIAGHLDTVHDPRGEFRELSVSSDEKTATGPGCVDMKGGLVIAMAALEAMEEAGEHVDWTLMLNSDEETGSYHSAGAIAAEASRVAKGGGIGIALEPATADGGLVVERGGSGQFMIEVRGKAAHVGRDFENGISAVNRLAEIILMVRDFVTEAAARPESSRRFIANIGPLQGGTATNVVPDLARAWGNMRFENSEAAEQFKVLLAFLDSPVKTQADDRGLAKVKVYSSFNRPAKPLTPGVERLADVCRVAAEELGQKMTLAKTAGVCDGNLMQAAGLPTIDTLGVRGGGLHTQEEWIEVGSLVERCQLLAVVMMRGAEVG